MVLLATNVAADDVAAETDGVTSTILKVVFESVLDIEAVDVLLEGELLEVDTAVDPRLLPSDACGLAVEAVAIGDERSSRLESRLSHLFAITPGR
jgi:hypothetical protein